MDTNKPITLGVRETFMYHWHKKGSSCAPVRFTASLWHSVKASIWGYSITLTEAHTFLQAYQPKTETGVKLKSRLTTILKNVQRNVGSVPSQPSRGKQPSQVSQGAGASHVQHFNPHSGNAHGPQQQGMRYTTSDVDQNTVKVEFTGANKPKQTAQIKHSIVTNESNLAAYSALTTQLGLSPTANFQQVQAQLAKRARASTYSPPITVLNGDVSKQLEFSEAQSKKLPCSLVVLNASQLNFKEQIEPGHDIVNRIDQVYNDNTFGPGVVKTQAGGPEFLAHRLGGDTTPFSGAFEQFFKEPRGLEDVGGYFGSNLTKQGWENVTDQLRQSPTKVRALRWQKENGTYVYQTGAINSKNGSAHHYDDLHKNAGPSEEIEFLCLYLQIRNALIQETKGGKPVAIHTTRVGFGVFSNKPGTFELALRAALASLSDEQRRNIRQIYVGTYLDSKPEWAKKLPNYQSVRQV